MHATRTRWLSAAHSAGWFQLTRHDDPDPANPPTDPAPANPPGDPADPDPTDPDPADPDGTGQLGDAGKRALDAMKNERNAAKKAAADERKRAEAAERKVQEFEDAQKNDLEKAQSEAQRATARAEAATKRAVTAEVRAAAADFADSDDAIAFLDLSAYADDSGEIDTEQIRTDLTSLLERKPHLRKASAPPADPQTDPAKPRPKPDPGQGPRPGSPATDFRTASDEEFRAELAKIAPGFRPRT
ncbi:hypothetical protein ABTY96_46520 [Streptomyces sp. NPDC096057]|uniref:hypothetical protein n=1 Tax=Streptomyces sp. NPDC096057 TaxID=3155543 RepID=UPI00332EBBE2